MTLPAGQTVRVIGGYCMVMVGTDPTAFITQADGSLVYRTFDVGDYANLAIRVTQQNPEQFQGPTGSPISVPGDRYDGQVVQDQQLRMLNGRQEEWLRRICLTIISCFKSPELSASELMQSIFADDGSGNDPLDTAFAGNYQFVEAA